MIEPVVNMIVNAVVTVVTIIAGVVVLYLRTRAAEVAARAAQAGSAQAVVASRANTTAIGAVHELVNGNRAALVARVAALEAELAARPPAAPRLYEPPPAA